MTEPKESQTKMPPLEDTQPFWKRPPAALAWLLAALLVAFTAYQRIALVRTSIPIAYAVPLLACLWFRNRAVLWSMVGAFGLITAYKYFFMEDFNPAVNAHRTLYWLVVLLDMLIIGAAFNWLNHVRDSLEQRASDLQQSNHELEAREEEIARQNEEMQSQAEELERQGADLRETNDELAARETMLQELLDLSRSLGGGLNQHQTMSHICEAAATLLSDAEAVSTIMERRGDSAVVLCHAGPSDDLTKAQPIPWENTFAAIVLNRGQAGFLEDVSLRPDLRLPGLGAQAAFKSILAAPITVRGKGVGALEVYSREKRSWSANEIALIESLAAQASISLDTARLFEEVDQQRRNFQAVFQTLPIGLLVAEDPQCQRVRGNPAATTMFGLPADASFNPDDMSAARFQMLQNDAPVPPQRHPLLRAVTEGEMSQNVEVDVITPQGRRLSLLVSAAPIHDAQGRITGGVCALVDISTLKRLQGELDARRREAEEASVRKTRFLAAVSHDIRTPANAINLLAELLRRAAGDANLSAEIPEMAQELQGSAMSLVNLVSDVLDVTRFDYGHTELQESHFPLQALLEEQNRQLQPLAQNKTLTLEVEAAPYIYLRADRVKLARILSNLIGNAIKFTEQGGIRVHSAVMDDGSVHISVADTGMGMSKADLPHIFDEFFQIKNPARDRNKGTGLGLAICQRLVQAMDGKLEVQSELHKGSTFTVIFPPSRVGRAPEDTPTTDGQARNGNGTDLKNQDIRPIRKPLEGITLLLVEDHPATRSATRQILAAEGGQVIEANDGQSGLRLLYERHPQVLLLDMMLPDIDGRELLRSIAAKRPPNLQTVLVLTGDVTAERSREVAQLGADGLIHKPIDLQRVVSIIRRSRVPAEAAVSAPA